MQFIVELFYDKTKYRAQKKSMTNNSSLSGCLQQYVRITSGERSGHVPHRENLLRS